jgi:hypothetical protein
MDINWISDNSGWVFPVGLAALVVLVILTVNAVVKIVKPKDRDEDKAPSSDEGRDAEESKGTTEPPTKRRLFF